MLNLQFLKLFLFQGYNNNTRHFEAEQSLKRYQLESQFYLLLILFHNKILNRWSAYLNLKLPCENNIFNFYINSSFIKSEYIESQRNCVEGNSVEFVPNINIKSGVKFGFNDLLSNIQFSYLSSQFTDASNAIESNLSGVIGEIPEYYILDFSSSYSFKKYKFEFGINNVLNYKYFTRRATGYPGPGIIPSSGMNLYGTLEIKI